MTSGDGYQGMPIVEITIDSMRHKIQSTVGQYLEKRNGDVLAMIEQAFERFDLDAEVRRLIDDAIRRETEGIVRRHFGWAGEAYGKKLTEQTRAALLEHVEEHTSPGIGKPSRAELQEIVDATKALNFPPEHHAHHEEEAARARLRDAFSRAGMEVGE